MTNILLVGGGKGGFALLKLLSRKRLINIVGICDISPNAPAIKLAEKLKIETGTDYKKFFDKEIDIIINVTNNLSVQNKLIKDKPPLTEVMGGNTSKITFALLEEINKKHEAEKTRNKLLTVLSEDTEINVKLNKSLGLIAQLTESDVLAVYLVENETKPLCWIVHDCHDKTCAAFNNFEACCWLICKERSEKNNKSGCEFCAPFYNIWFKPVASFAVSNKNPSFKPIKAKSFKSKDLFFQATSFSQENVIGYPFSCDSNERKQKVKSQLVCPLFSPSGLLGFLYLATFKEKAFFEEKGVVNNIAHDLAFAIENENVKSKLNERLLQLEVIRRVGLSLTSEKDIDGLFSSIVQSSLKLTDSSAGSLAIYNQKENCFELVSSIGFSPEFSKTLVWKRRKGGLTDSILQNKGPFIISNASRFSSFDNPLFLKEGIKSLVAVPLLSRDEIIGILYIDDFKVRT
ncbi:MAG: GAF domain-containing protein, partial [Actinomycetia bacterium]|nr:GAF domain-containing protein [Actinomycetes bacterium]